MGGKGFAGAAGLWRRHEVDHDEPKQEVKTVEAQTAEREEHDWRRDKLNEEFEEAKRPAPRVRDRSPDEPQA